jgi:hypothetical protein
MDDIERSESGSPIYRHKPRENSFEAPEDSCVHLQEIEAHLERHLGEVTSVFHELVSDLVHLDVLFLEPTPERPYKTLVTSGVSDRPMSVPEGAEDFQYAELMINLPEDWPLDQKSFEDEANYWPVRWLKMVGRLPHEYKTWIGWGHTIPNGDPAEPIADTQFTGVMLSPPYFLDSDFFRLKTASGAIICFYNLVPLYREEMDLKLKQGADALEDLFEKNGVDFEVLDIERKNVAKKRGWFR